MAEETPAAAGRAPTTGGAPRQWRVTITEEPRSGDLRAVFSWRTFPCAATQWHGHKSTIIRGPSARIRSSDDLEAVLAHLVDSDWSDRVR